MVIHFENVINRPLGYDKVYLPLYKGADTAFHIQGDGISFLVYGHCEDRHLMSNYELISALEGLGKLVAFMNRMTFFQ